jgi:hypothetical protein
VARDGFEPVGRELPHDVHLEAGDRHDPAEEALDERVRQMHRLVEPRDLGVARAAHGAEQIKVLAAVRPNRPAR